ncbi:hypothetical protein [Pseudovibrio sp. Tun.PSC04-5.I4]|uniref:hypothetical protein n=1 Tax=Pseudovibrio sp. Tun.PSC04-5.I4 TaxID=1798213 RepID=UPI00087ED24B|nr:hypothetical protein [Pseudovibrio sp. Tun.PSC04-5.I4]SDQ20459.1 hypothetical protein SAMN04515695_0461 [Pseudovibrio sp. Tun.PSC04-5.I4]
MFWSKALQHLVVTSFHQQGYETYGKNCILSFLKNWPEHVRMLIYAENVQVEEIDPRLIVLDQNEALPELEIFKKTYSDHPFANGACPTNPDRTNHFRWDAVRFSNKVFAISDAIRNNKHKLDQLIWLDADTITHQPIPAKFLDKLAPRGKELAAYLNRRGCPECGWVGYNLRHPNIDDFAEHFENIYTSGDFLELEENHDSYVFWHLVKKYQNENIATFKLLGSRYASGHIFINSSLGKYMDHLKGPRKDAGKSSPKDLHISRKEPWWTN